MVKYPTGSHARTGLVASQECQNNPSDAISFGGPGVSVYVCVSGGGSVIMTNPPPSPSGCHPTGPSTICSIHFSGLRCCMVVF